MTSFKTKFQTILFTCACLLLLMACQEDPLETKLDPMDEDMKEAVTLADQFLNTANPAGRHSRSSMAVTVLKFYRGSLYYATNTDALIGYRVVTEETITASVGPGESIFWFAGPGIADLVGIEFDEVSQAELDEFPEEIIRNRMWKVMMPENVSSEDITLKYDILYRTYGGEEVIRLDPKIKINQSETD